MANLADLQEDKCRLCGEPRPKDIWHIWACCGDGPGYGDTIKPEKLACVERQLAQAKAALAESRGAQSRPASSPPSAEQSRNRAAWAVAVLDAFADKHFSDREREGRPPYASRDKDPAGKGYVVCVHQHVVNGIRYHFAIYEGATADEARIAAAEALVASDPSLNVQPEPSGDAGQGDGREVWVTTDADGTPVVVDLEESEALNEASGVPGALVVRYVPACTVPARSLGGWIRCEDRLPEESQPVVVLGEHWSGHGTPPELAEREGPASQVVWRRFLADDTDDEVSLYIEDKVTHWLPIPPPPAPEKP